MKIQLLKDKRYKFGFYLAKGEIRDAVWNDASNRYQTKTSEGVILSIPKKDAVVVDGTIIK